MKACNGVALSLGSCFRGFYTHCGFLAEFDAAGPRPAKLAGTSSGAYAGLLYALGMKGDDLIRFILQPGVTRSFLDWSILWRFPGIATWTFGTGFFSANRAVAFLKQRLGEVRLEALRDPILQVAVTDLNSGQALVVEEGDALEHVIASCAVPGLFAARRVGPRLLWDGAIANDVPFIHWLDDPDIHTIVLHSIEHASGAMPVPRWPNMALGVGVGHQLVSTLLNDYRERLVRASGKRLLRFVTNAPHPGLLRDRRAALVEAGRETGRRAAEEVRRAIS